MPISKSSHKKQLGITLGDPAGIGPEITARALARPSIRRLGPFTIIGDPAALKQFGFTRNKNCACISPEGVHQRSYSLGKPNTASAQAAWHALHTAVDLVKRGEISGLVTSPVCKETICRFDKSFVGHTEFLADAFGITNVSMMFVAGKMRTVLVTRHIPLNRVSRTINQNLVFHTIALTHQSLKRTFHIPKPSIAVCGLNPHAGEGGTIGREEITKIIPAIKKARRLKISVLGPFPADTLFSAANIRRYDAIVAMYHDQGLTPAKSLCFNNLVNVTIGLPFIRTSPAHGTAFDIAGKDKADPTSMGEAIKLAARLIP